MPLPVSVPSRGASAPAHASPRFPAPDNPSFSAAPAQSSVQAASTAGHRTPPISRHKPSTSRLPTEPDIRQAFDPPPKRRLPNRFSRPKPAPAQTAANPPRATGGQCLATAPKQRHVHPVQPASMPPKPAELHPLVLHPQSRKDLPDPPVPPSAAPTSPDPSDILQDHPPDPNEAVGSRPKTPPASHRFSATYRPLPSPAPNAPSPAIRANRPLARPHTPGAEPTRPPPRPDKSAPQAHSTAAPATPLGPPSDPASVRRHPAVSVPLPKPFALYSSSFSSP